MDEYRKAAGGSGSGRCRLLLSALAAQLQAPASFLLTCDLPNEAVLLTDQTTVTLSNIEISEKLFSVLLSMGYEDTEENAQKKEKGTDAGSGNQKKPLSSRLGGEGNTTPAGDYLGVAENRARKKLHEA
ncbi:MAG: uncharacterized protein A8A55_3481, partial [Amphiamblys sp. WSBS2006]